MPEDEVTNFKEEAAEVLTALEAAKPGLAGLDTVRRMIAARIG